MTKFTTALAVAALVAASALAQGPAQAQSNDPNSSSGDYGAPSPSTGGSSMGRIPGASTAPADCMANDPRPACQQAQLLDQTPSSPGSSATPPANSPWTSPSPGTSPGTSGSGSKPTPSTP